MLNFESYSLIVFSFISKCNLSSNWSTNCVLLKPPSDHFSHPSHCPWPVTLPRVALSIYFHFISLSKLRVSANTTTSLLHTGVQSPKRLRKQHLISAWTQCASPVCPLSLLRTSKRTNNVGHSSHWWARSCIPGFMRIPKASILTNLKCLLDFFSSRGKTLALFEFFNLKGQLSYVLWCSNPILIQPPITRSLFWAKFNPSVARISLSPPLLIPAFPMHKVQWGKKKRLVSKILV